VGDSTEHHLGSRHERLRLVNEMGELFQSPLAALLLPSVRVAKTFMGSLRAPGDAPKIRANLVGAALLCGMACHALLEDRLSGSCVARGGCRGDCGEIEGGFLGCSGCPGVGFAGLGHWQCITNHLMLPAVTALTQLNECLATENQQQRQKHGACNLAQLE